MRKGKTVAVALAKVTFRKGKECIPFEKVISDFNWQIEPKIRPEMIDDFAKGETLLLENCEELFINGKR